MTIRTITGLAATVLAVTSSLLVAGPADAAPADYHLSWYNTAEGTDKYDRYSTYQGVIDKLRASEIGTVNLSQIPTSGRPEASCGSALPTNTPGTTALCWTSTDNRNAEWVPQGITTNQDASGGAVSKILVTWYDGCSEGTPGPDTQGCQNGPTPSQDPPKGVQVSIYSPGGGYRNVLLVEPFFNSSHNPSFHATHMHAGGIALYGNFLYVADTKNGMRVFDTRQIFDMETWQNLPFDPYDLTKVGRHDSTWYSHGYRYLWPAVGEWRLDSQADGSACLGEGKKLKFSFLSVDRVSNNLVAGEYCPEPEGTRTAGRVARYQLGSTTSAAQGLATGWAWDGGRIDLPRDHVQGVVSQGSTFYVNTSDGQNHGTLWKYDLVGGRLTNERHTEAAIGCEDLSYDSVAGRVYSLSEYYGQRAIYSVPAGF